MPQYGDLIYINRKASGAVSPYRFVKGTATDGVVAQSSAKSDAHVGICGQIGAADGLRLDIVHAGITDVEFGGTVAFGDPLTADANGKAVKAGPGDRVAAFALENATAGVIGTCILALGAGYETAEVSALPDFVANDSAPAAIEHDRIYTVPSTGAASTVTLPAAAPDGTRAFFVANGVLNGHTVQYRDATGPTVVTAALTASKRHLVTAIKIAGVWTACSGVSP